MSKPRVLDVGQCDYDHGQISSVLRGRFSAEVVRAHTAEEALGEVKKGGYALVLVNRLFDVDHDSGIEFIKRVKGDAATQAVPVMLVSNLEDAQAQAAAVGAVPGFGKAALKNEATVDLLAPHLGGGIV
jgi:CheY-like chemotaxis protein